MRARCADDGQVSKASLRAEAQLRRFEDLPSSRSPFFTLPETVLAALTMRSEATNGSTLVHSNEATAALLSSSLDLQDYDKDPHFDLMTSAHLASAVGGATSGEDLKAAAPYAACKARSCAPFETVSLASDQS